MKLDSIKRYSSHGSGDFTLDDFAAIGDGVVFERGVLVFHAKAITIGDNVYIGHNTILKGYHKNTICIGSNTWIGQDCFFHGAGGLEIGNAVGIGPKVSVLTSSHRDHEIALPILFHELVFKPVRICDGADIGVSSILLPGVTIGEGAVVGAGSVVTKDVEPFSVVAGNPARFLRSRTDTK